MTTKMIKINLLPGEFKEKLTPAHKKFGLDIPKFIPISLIGLISLLVAVNLLSLLYASSARNKLAAQKDKFDRTKQLAEQARKLEEDLPELRKKDQFLTANVEKKLQCWRVMEQVILSCPGPIRVSDMRVSRSGIGNLVVIEGSYKEGDYLEEQFRTRLSENEPLKKYFTNFRPERRVDPGEGTRFTIIGSTQ